MPRADINRLVEMEIFVAVVQRGSFSATARACRLTPSAVSKAMARLEKRLNTRLINRSTRKLQLTPEGQDFYQRSVRIIADLQDAERCMDKGRQVSGSVRVSVSIPVGRHLLLPLLPEFQETYPGLQLDVSLTDQVVDLLDDYADIAIRSGPLKDSSLIARKLGQTRMLMVASPHYLARHDIPRTRQALKEHNLLRFGFRRSLEAWPLIEQGQETDLMPEGNLTVSDGESMRQLAIAGAGIARLADFMLQEDLQAGRLVEVMADANPGGSEEVHAVFLGHGGYLPARVRVLLDFLYQRLRVGGAPGKGPQAIPVT